MGNKLKAVPRCPSWCSHLWLGQQSRRVIWYSVCDTRSPSERGTDVRGIFHVQSAVCVGWSMRGHESPSTSPQVSPL